MKQIVTLVLLLLLAELFAVPVQFAVTIPVASAPIAGTGSEAGMVLQQDFTVPPTLNEVISDEGNLLQVSGLDTSIEPGAPLIPQYNLHLTLQGWYQIDAVTVSEGEVKQGATLDQLIPAHNRVVWDGSPQQFSRTPDPDIYTRDAAYPGNWLEFTAGYDGSVTHIYVQLYPAQWNPVTRQVHYLTRGTLWVSGSRMQTVPMPGSGVRTDAQHIYICPAGWTSVADSMADFHTNQGITTDVVDIDWISANYTAAENPSNPGYANQSNPNIQGYDFDLAKQIIAYLRDDQAHPNLEMITICGSGIDVPPSYYFFFYNDYDGWVPSDHFYASPDFDWEDNFSVNRIAVQSLSELSAYFQKAVTWNSSLSGNWIQRATVSGGMPFDTPYFVGELINNQVVCDDLFDEFEIEKYQRHTNLFSAIPFTNHMKDDDYLLNLHVCHGSGSAIYFDNNSDISASDMMGFPQKSRLPLMLSVACINAAYDTEIYPGGFSRSFGQGMLASPGAGIGYVGGTRSNGGTPEYYISNGNLVFTGHIDTYSLLYYFLEGYRSLPAPTMGQCTVYAKERYLETRPMNGNNQAAYVRLAALVDGALILPDASTQNPTTTPPSVSLNDASGTNGEGWQTKNLTYNENPVYSIMNPGDYTLEWIDIEPAENVYQFGPVSTDYTLDISPWQHQILCKVITDESKEAWHYSAVNKEEYLLRVLDGSLDDWNSSDIIATDPAGDIQQSTLDLTSLMFTTDDYTDQFYFAFPIDFDETNFGTSPVIIYFVMAFDTEPGGYRNNYIQGDLFPIPNVWCGFDNAEIDRIIHGQIIYFNQISNLDVELKVYNAATDHWDSGLLPGACINADALELGVSKSYFTGEYVKMALFSSINGGIIHDAIPANPQCPTTITYGQENAFSLDSYIDMTPLMTSSPGQIVPSVGLEVHNYPNPFNPETTIQYQLSQDGPVTIDIFNVKGQKVVRLVDEHQDAGMHSAVWNGTDQNDKTVGSGLFFCKLRSDNGSCIRKMILMK